MMRVIDICVLAATASAVQIASDFSAVAYDRSLAKRKEQIDQLQSVKLNVNGIDAYCAEPTKCTLNRLAEKFELFEEKALFAIAPGGKVDTYHYIDHDPSVEMPSWKKDPLDFKLFSLKKKLTNEDEQVVIKVVYLTQTWWYPEWYPTTTGKFDLIRVGDIDFTSNTITFENSFGNKKTVDWDTFLKNAHTPMSAKAPFLKRKNSAVAIFDSRL